MVALEEVAENISNLVLIIAFQLTKITLNPYLNFKSHGLNSLKAHRLQLV